MIRTHTIWQIFALFILLGSTSCFEIVEEVSLHTDGSGTLSFTLNASKSQARLKSVMLMDSVNGRPVPQKSDIDAELSKARRILSGMPGISAIVVKSNHEDFIYSLSGNFASIPQLNAAMNTLATEMRKGRANLQPIAFTPFDNYGYSNGVFQRFQDPKDRSGDYTKAKKEDRDVVDNAEYTCIYRFDSTVRSQTNPKANISKSGKAVMIRTKIRDIIMRKSSIRNKITLN